MAEAWVTQAAAEWIAASFFCAEGERLGWVAEIIVLFVPEADAEWEAAYGALLDAHACPAEWDA